MLTGKFDIEFTCKVPRHGYEWYDEWFLRPKRNTGIKSVDFSLEAYDDFRRVIQYKISESDWEREDISETIFATHNAELLRFFNKWGNPFSDEMDFFAEHEFLKAWTSYLNLLEAFKENKLPDDPSKYLPDFNITYGWDRHGNKVVPIFRPSCLWDAIQIVMVFSGIDAREVSGECSREGCNEVFSGRSNKKYCSESCRKKAWEYQNSRNTRSQIKE